MKRNDKFCCFFFKFLLNNNDKKHDQSNYQLINAIRKKEIYNSIITLFTILKGERERERKEKSFYLFKMISKNKIEIEREREIILLKQ